MKKLTALLLALALCVGLLPTASAADAPTSGSCGENVTWSFDAASGTLTIEGTGAMEDYETTYDYDIGAYVTDAPWYRYADEITSAVIGEGVTNIGSSAFFFCTSLISVDIPSTVTSIGDDAFSECGALASIELPENLISIGTSAFYNCTSLKSIVIPESVVGIGEEAFSACSGLESVVLDANITSLEYGVFMLCTSLKSITVPPSVTSIGDYAFFGCSSLAEVSIPSGVTEIGDNAFWSCAFSSFELSPHVTRIGRMAFSSCTKLTSIHIPKSVTSIGSGAFYGCTSLAEVTGGENVTEIEGGIFQNTQVTSPSDFIIFGSTLVDYVGEGGDVVVPDGITTVSGSAFYEEHATVNSVVFPEGVETLGSNLFNGAHELTSVTLPASLKTIEGAAFYSCMKLNDIYYGATREQWREISVGVSNAEIFDATIHFTDGTSAVASELGAPEGVLLWQFSEGTGKMTVRGSAEMEDFWYRTDPGRANCGLVTELVIEDGVQSIGNYAFAGFSQITTVTIPDSVKRIGTGAFAGCTSLETIYIGSGVTEMGFMLGSSIFSHVSDFYPEKAELIKNIYVDEDNPAFADIDGVLFDKDLTTLVYYPRGREAEHYNVPHGVTTIGSEAFRYNMWQAQHTPAIRSVYLPESVTEIREFAFGEGISYEYREEPSAWAQTEVDEAIALGLVPHDLQRGYTVGTTREEYCRFVVELIESVSGKTADEFLAELAVSADDIHFTDTDAAHVRIAGALGVVQGIGDGRFDPDTALTREAAATMLARLAALFTEVDALPYAYDDAPQIASWARDSVYAMRALGVMHGDDMNRFDPRSTYTREAAILTIVRMHKALTEGVERTQQLYPMLAEVSGEYLWGCVDESGAFVLEPQYAYLDWSGDYGIAALPDAPNEYFVIDRAGEFVMAAEGHHEERIPKLVGNMLYIDIWGSQLTYRLPDGEQVAGGMQKVFVGSSLNSGYVTVFDDMNKWAGLIDRSGETVLSTDDHWMFCGTPFGGKVILGKGYPDEYHLWNDGAVTPLPALTGSYISNNSVGDLYRLELSLLNEDNEFEYLYGLNTVYGEILPPEYAEIELTPLGQAIVRKDDASPWELYSRAGKLCELPDFSVDLHLHDDYITDGIAHYAFEYDGEVYVVSTRGVETARIALPDGADFAFVNGLVRVTTANESAYYTPHGEVTFGE